MHTILVMLVGNDHKPLGPQQQLTVTVLNATAGISTPPKPDAAAQPGAEKPKY